MPPDRGSSTKTQKIGIKKESKLSIPPKDKKSDEIRSKTKTEAKPSKTQLESKTSRDASLARQRTKLKETVTSSPSGTKLKETVTSSPSGTKLRETVTSSPSGKFAKSSRADVAKLMDVKKDVEKDTRKAKELLARNRSVKNSPYNRTAIRAGVEKVSSEGLMKNVLNNGPAGNKKIPISSSTRKSQHTSAVKAMPPNIEENNSPRSRLEKIRKSIQKQDSVEHRSREKTLSKDKEPKKLSRERTRTRTLSPHEVKVAKRIGNPSTEMQSTSKASLLSNDAADAIPSTSKAALSQECSTNEQISEALPVDESDNYEDDFEDYESDFEEDISESSKDSKSASELTSESEDSSLDESKNSRGKLKEIPHRPVEEEKKMDSGNYDLTNSKKKDREIQLIKEALERENADVSTHRTVNKNSAIRSLPIAHDEGFEEEKTDVGKTFQAVKNAVVFNFAGAKKKMEEQKVSAKTKKRGEEVLSMIQLDVVHFSLIDLPPVPYDVYIKSYGRSNSLQASVQTNEDDLSEEVQTDEILSENKWTQHPIAYRTFVKEDNKKSSPFIFSQDHMGSGGDHEKDPARWKEQLKYNAFRLNQFLLNAGQAILQHLEERLAEPNTEVFLKPDVSYLSSGFYNLNINSAPFLSGRQVSLLCFCENHVTRLLTVHSLHNTTSKTEAFVERSLLCVWNVLKPAVPEKILGCSNEVAAACFHPSRDNLVFGGLCEGTVCLWDLRESAADHCLGATQPRDWIIRSPTYSTAEILKNEGHLSTVSAICPVGSDLPDAFLVNAQLAPIQVCSVEVAGVAIIWTVIQNTASAVKTGLALEDLGIAYWGRVQIVPSIVINILEGLDLNSNFLSNVECRGMITDPEDPSHFYVFTNSGHVIHCLSSGCKPRPKVYSSSEDGFSPATCIENLVDRHYMLVGYEGGIIRLYNRNSNKPLATFAGTGDVLSQGPSVQSIQSLCSHPTQFFILDKTSRIHVWNLINSDILPVTSLNLGQKVSTMKLSKAKDYKSIYMAIATVDGEVEIHRLKPEFCLISPAEFEQELQGFRAYAREL